MAREIKLKYLCTSFSTSITQQDVFETGDYSVYGASGFVGYLNIFNCDSPYLGIIKDGAGVGRINKYKEKTSLLGTMAYIIPNNEVNIDWLKYVIEALDLGKDIGKTTIPHIYFSNYGNRKVYFVDLEQQKIASFLDQKCAEIDAVIEKTKATIEEYKKLKQSVITEAVTKGIRGNRPMKDSGIEWIGEIPVEWDVQKLKYISKFKQNKYSDKDGDLRYIGLENIVAWNGRYVETDSVYDKEQSLICDTNDILFGKLRPYLAKVYISSEKQCCSGEFSVISIKKYNHVFMFYQMISYGFIFMVNRSTYGTKMPRANADYIKNMFVSIPKLDEQKEIVNYLDQKCAEIDTLIAKKTTLLTELETYKKSLIYEYVTGKKEVN